MIKRNICKEMIKLNPYRMEETIKGINYEVVDSEGLSVTNGITFNKYNDALDFERYYFHGGASTRAVLMCLHRIEEQDNELIGKTTVHDLEAEWR